VQADKLSAQLAKAEPLSAPADRSLGMSAKAAQLLAQADK